MPRVTALAACVVVGMVLLGCGRARDGWRVAEQSVSAEVADEAATPTWVVGTEWVFAWRYKDRAGATRSGKWPWVVGRAVSVEGHDCYAIRTTDGEIFYRRDDLAWVQEVTTGVVRAVPPQTLYRWPLRVGLAWEQKFVEQSWKGRVRFMFDRERHTEERVRSWRVTSLEKVEVPAGIFSTFKIEEYDVATGRLVAELWYSPQVRQRVKTYRRFDDGGERHVEMTSYKIPAEP
jgi:hypothetical protein